MKRPTLFLLLNIAILSINFAQVIPAERLVNWSKAGTTTIIFDHEINVLEHGLINDGSTNNAGIFGDLMSQYSEPTTFYFPAGTYLFTESIYLASNVLIKGASSEETVFQFHDVPTHLIQTRGSVASDSIPIAQSIQKGNNYLFTENAASFQEGDLVKIVANDSSLVTSEWAIGTTGQILDIQYINNDILAFQQEFRRDYDLNDNPILVKIEPIKNVGIECLKITRNNATTALTSNIFFENSTNCWVKGVESDHCNFGHIDIRFSSRVTVESGYFHHAFDYGGGGKAYGVVAHLTASDCLIQNNVFENLRHSMLLQAGANGNVLAYNYSTLPYGTETTLPVNAAGDIVLHGNYPYANLFEGNIVQNIVVDASHGKNGPFNTFFRNRTELYGLFTDFMTPTDELNIIGNTIIAGNVAPLYFLNGEGHFAYSNYFQGNILPENTNDLTDTSLFLSETPSFFPEGFPFTLLDNLPENTNFSTPAKDRFFTSTKTLCGEPMPYVVSNTHKVDLNDLNVNCYPNPLNIDKLTIELEGQIISKPIEIAIYNSIGQRMQAYSISDNKAIIDLSNFENGVYFLFGRSGGQLIFNQQIVKI